MDWQTIGIILGSILTVIGLPSLEETEAEIITLSQLEELIREGYHG
jgi:hypothetical protein